MSHMDNPFLSGKAVTPSDTDVIPKFRSLYIGGAGDVTVQFQSGEQATFFAVPVGQYVWAQGVKVLATGTGATNILALY